MNPAAQRKADLATQLFRSRRPRDARGDADRHDGAAGERVFDGPGHRGLPAHQFRRSACFRRCPSSPISCRFSSCPPLARWRPAKTLTILSATACTWSRWVGPRPALPALAAPRRSGAGCTLADRLVFCLQPPGRRGRRDLEFLDPGMGAGAPPRQVLRPRRNRLTQISTLAFLALAGWAVGRWNYAIPAFQAIIAGAALLRIRSLRNQWISPTQSLRAGAEPAPLSLRIGQLRVLLRRPPPCWPSSPSAACGRLPPTVSARSTRCSCSNRQDLSAFGVGLTAALSAAGRRPLATRLGLPARPLRQQAGDDRLAAALADFKFFLVLHRCRKTGPPLRPVDLGGGDQRRVRPRAVHDPAAPAAARRPRTSRSDSTWRSPPSSPRSRRSPAATSWSGHSARTADSLAVYHLCFLAQPVLALGGAFLLLRVREPAASPLSAVVGAMRNIRTLGGVLGLSFLTNYVSLRRPPLRPPSLKLGLRPPFVVLQAASASITW